MQRKNFKVDHTQLPFSPEEKEDFLACIGGWGLHLDAVNHANKIIQKKSFDNNKDIFNHALFLSVDKKYMKDVFNQLIKKGARFSEADKIKANEMLLNQASWGDFERVKKLVQGGANINAKDSQNVTALMKSIWRSHTKIVKFLIDEGADIFAKDEMGRMALHYARCDSDITKLLLAGRVDIESRDNYGMTALLYGITASGSVTKLLLDHGADAKACDNQGNNALMLIAQHHSIKLFELFLKRGLDINSQNQDGVTPLMFAIKAQRKDSVIYLLENGADIRIRDKSGKNARDWAKSIERKDLVEILNTAANYDENQSIKKGHLLSFSKFAYRKDIKTPQTETKTMVYKY